MTTLRKVSTLLMAAFALVWSVSAQAQPFRGRAIIVPRVHVWAPYYYDPLWGPYYPYGSFFYGAYPYAVRSTADVRVEVIPKQAEVFVDGYYAGTAEDFDGVFKRLHTTPGGHAITLHLDGYRTVTEDIYVRPGSTFKMQDTMDKLAAGEVSTPPPAPSPEPATPSPAGTPGGD